MFHISGTRRKEEALVGDSLGGGNSQGDSSGGSVAANRDDKGGAQGISQSKNGVVAPLSCPFLFRDSWLSQLR